MMQQPWSWFVLAVSCLLVAGRWQYVSADQVDDDLLEFDITGNKFRQADVLRDAEHILEHHGNRLKFDPHLASPEELEFHFFKAHDLNDDNKLDGTEIMAALSHGAKAHYDHIMERAGELTPHELRRRTAKLNDRLAHTVDTILSEDDLNNDGFLTYAEYVQARRANVALERAAESVKD